MSVQHSAHRPGSGRRVGCPADKSSGPSSVSVPQSHGEAKGGGCACCKCRFLGPGPYGHSLEPGNLYFNGWLHDSRRIVPWCARPCFILGSPSVPGALVWSANSIACPCLPPSLSASTAGGGHPFWCLLDFPLQVLSTRGCREEQKPLLWEWTV